MDISGTPYEGLLKMTDEQAAEILSNYHNACISGRRNGKVFTALAFDTALNKAIERLKEPPRPQGKWKHIIEEDNDVECPFCGFQEDGLYYDFCPGCGADMRGGVE